MSALIDITESLCLAVASGNLGEARRLAVVASDRMGPTRARRVQLALRRPVVPDIQEAVAESYRIHVLDLKGGDRCRDISRARAIAMYLVRELAGLSYPRIGAWFGGRDHTTAMAACEKVRRWMKGDRKVAAEVKELRLWLTVRRVA